LAEKLPVKRKIRGKAKNKRFLLAYLESNGWDYHSEFVETWESASPDEKLRFFGKTFPFLFHKVQDDKPTGDTNVNIIMANIGTPQDLAQIIMKDPFIDHAKLIEGEVRNVEQKAIKNSPPNKSAFLSELREIGAESISIKRTVGKRKSNPARSLQNKSKTRSRKKLPVGSSKGSN